MPTQEQALRPILETVADGRAWRLEDVERAVADQFALNETSRELRVKSGDTVLSYRIGWARTSLVKAGLVEQPAPSMIVITDAGRSLLASREGPFDYKLLREEFPTFATWLADMGQLPDEELPASIEPTVWMLRAGREGVYAAAFVERSLAVVGWGQTGDVSDVSREALEKTVARCFPDATPTQRSQATNTLLRMVHTIADGDLVITPEPASRTLLLGRVAGPYLYLEEPLGNEYNHARSVRWFARVPRDELSYGARNSLGALMTLSRPSHASELLQLADAHANDPPPARRSFRRRSGVSRDLISPSEFRSLRMHPSQGGQRFRNSKPIPGRC